MHYDRYELTPGESGMTFHFVSKGVMGNVEKLVVYTETDFSGVFNLGFGDRIGSSDDFEDEAVTNNGDSLKVMITVAATLYPFTDQFPAARVYVKRSTKSRTRLYRMGIASNLKVISIDFQVYGLRQEQWERFTVGIDYDAFFVTRKNEEKWKRS